MKQILTAILVLFCSSCFAQLTWRPIVNGPSSPYRMDDIWFINPNTGWVIVENSSACRVHKTTDAGDNWNAYLVSNQVNARCITFADSLNGWLGTIKTNGTIIYRTSNGGVNWSSVLTTVENDSNSVCGIWAVDKNTIYAAGRYYGPAKFYKSTNGGDSWSVTPLAQYGIYFLIDIHFFNKDSGFVTGGTGLPSHAQSKGVVLFTSNGGNTWVNKITTVNTSQWGWKFSFPDRNNGFVSLENNSTIPKYFLSTSNGGETWEEKFFLDSLRREQGIGFINANTGWIGGDHRGAYKTTNAGVNWSFAGIGLNINRFRVLSDTLAYASGDKVYKFSRDSVVSIDPVSSSIPSGFVLHQNYPNPFNPKTTITFEIPRKSSVELTMYNVSGDDIMKLHSGVLSAGIYNYNLNSAVLPSGVYFYTLKAEGFKETKKMLLLK